MSRSKCFATFRRVDHSSTSIDFQDTIETDAKGAWASVYAKFLSTPDPAPVSTDDATDPEGPVIPEA